MEGPAVSIGNYKGVMLCNRPFVGGAAKTPSGAAVRQAFICGNVGDKWGSNVPISSKERPVFEKPKNSALQKHRKWLEELKETKAELERRFASESEAKLAKKQRFMKREAKMRAMIRSMKDDEDELSRPMWALTAKQAEAAEEQADNDNADDLVDFAQNLDFDKYIHDAEVSSLIENVRARIQELEDSDAKSDASADRRLAADVKGCVAKARPPVKDYDDVPRAEPKDEDDDDDAASVAAQSLLDGEDGKALGAVHSKKSLTVLANRSKAAALAPSAAALDPITESPARRYDDDDEPAMPKPIIVKHTDDNGTRLEAKLAVAKLPYMHRNPAI